ncbi:unnamed protein product, partial [Rotaria sordida]
NVILYFVNWIFFAALDATPTSVVPHNVPCSPDVGKVVLVIMAGEHRTQIRDDQSTRAALAGNTRNYQHLAITLYEDTVYLLRIQFECTGSQNEDSVGNNCNLPHDVAASIDLNDDGRFNDIENAAPYRWPVTSYTPQGIYDLQIYVPDIDGTKTKSGPHRMRLDITLNEQYRQKCGKNYYRDTREYNITIVRKNMKQTVDIGGSYLTLSNAVCSKAHAKIVLVIMAGEKGSHIRDDTPLNTAIREDQNRHHLAVTLYENTIYRIRIQLDCDQPSSRGSFNINCNLAYDVNVYIDLNNDGRFDESESRVPHRWPLRSTMTLGIYDLEIPIPSIDGLTTKDGSHIMRIVVKSSEEYNRICGRYDYSETREYTVNIIPKEPSKEISQDTYVTDYRLTHCSPGNLVCSVGHSAIFSVSISGEQNTQIRDETRKCSSTNNYNDQSNLAVTLFDNTVYTLRIALSCVQQSGYDNIYNQDPYVFETYCRDSRYLGMWIDFNNDGTFDDNTERIIPNHWYTDDPHMTQSDISFTIPQIDGRYYVGGQHRARIVLVQDTRNRKPCQNNGYGEVRDYTVNIIQKEVLQKTHDTGYVNRYSQDPYVFETYCHDSRYLGMWIDFNNDGTFDDNTEQIIPNNWYRDDPRMTQSTIRFTIPQIDGRYYVGGQHRVRIVLVQDARNRKPCQNTGYGEVRDYTVNIIRKEVLKDTYDTGNMLF